MNHTMKTRIVFLSLILSTLYCTHNLWSTDDQQLKEKRPKKRAQLESENRTKIQPLNESMKAIMEINRNCTEHFYDRSEWTLRMFEEKDERCAEKRKVLFKKNMVKALIRGNGYENLGCRSDTAMCKEKAHYDEVNRIRVNTPPCCRAKIVEMFKHTTQALSKQNISHFLQFGGLIGYYRNQHIVPYDSDMDLYVDGIYWNDPQMFQIIDNLRKTHGYKFQLRDNGMKMKVFYSNTNNNSIDLWPFKVELDKYQRPLVKIHHWSAVDQPMANIFPLSSVQFEGIWTFVPRVPKDVLDLQYGSGYWEREIDCKYIDTNGNCIPKSNLRRESHDDVIPYLLAFLLFFVIAMVLLFVLIIKCVYPINDVSGVKDTSVSCE